MTSAARPPVRADNLAGAGGRRGGPGGGPGGGGGPQSDAPPELHTIHRGTVASVRTFGVFVKIEGFRKCATWLPLPAPACQSGLASGLRCLCRALPEPLPRTYHWYPLCRRNGLVHFSQISDHLHLER